MKNIPYGKQNISEKDIEAVVEVLGSDWLTQGPKVKEFEDAIAEYCGAKYAVAVNSGTAALHAAAFAVGVSEGCEIITTPITFAASANSCLYLGAVPRFADIDPDSYNISPTEIKKALSPKTKAIVGVDFTGLPFDYNEIKEICDEQGLALIQDAAHSLGASYKEQRVGSYADITTISFHPVKHITTGEGGVALTSNEEYYEKMMMFRTHGITKNEKYLEANHGGWYYEMHFLGYNYRITDLQAALGISQLSRLDGFLLKRKEIVKRYYEAFSSVKGIILPRQFDDRDPAWHLFVVRFDQNALSVNRKDIYNHLKSKGIHTQVHYIPVHLQPYYRKHFDYNAGDFPVSEKYYETCLSLPIFPALSKEDQDYTIETLIDFLNVNS